MKNTKSLSVLIAIAAVEFAKKENEHVNKLFATEDGFMFIEENRAQIHCKSVLGMKLYPITRAEALNAEVVQETTDAVLATVTKAMVSDNASEPKVIKDGSLHPGEMDALKSQYEELFGKAAHHNVGIDKLKTLIAEKLSELDQEPGEGENNQEPA